MSSQRGNVRKTGPPKHKNKTGFKNNLHDSTRKTQQMNKMEIAGCCARCRDVLTWKIKYKKYKPLTQPTKCVKCSRRNVNKAYFSICDECAGSLGVCGKCGKKEDLVAKPGLTPEQEAAQQSQLEQELKFLSERQRRSFLRNQAAGKYTTADICGSAGGSKADNICTSEGSECTNDESPSCSDSEDEIANEEEKESRLQDIDSERLAQEFENIKVHHETESCSSKEEDRDDNNTQQPNNSEHECIIDSS